MPVITMGGLEWGGARSLGPLVAEKLGADYVDKLILTDIARHVGATVNALHERESRPPTRGDRFSRVLLRIMERMGEGGTGDSYFGGGLEFFTKEYEELPQPIITSGHEIEDEPYIEALTMLMKEVASSGNVVIVGRAGYIIFKDDPRVLRVGVVADFEDRITTIMERESLDRKQAEKTLLAREKARGYLFKRFFDIDDPDDPELYHLVINTSLVRLDYAADVVIDATSVLPEGQSQRQGQDVIYV